jgi:2-polyprenyl-6-methoxyphenol hydroxylase-like FAD-dependent oxidoreductase
LPESTDVLVSGGGPVGLATAVELGRRGISCVVVEPRSSVSRARPRCKTVNVRTMEHLRRWGLAERFRAAAPLSPRWSQDIVFCTTLIGREISRFTGVFGLNADPERCPEVGQQAPQYVLEELLREVVAALPTCSLALGWRVVTLDDAGARVRVTVDGPGGSAEVEAQYVVGCDGAKSAVREAIGARYVGKVAVRPSFGAVIEAPDLLEQVPYGRAIHYWVLDERAPATLGPLDGKTLWWATFPNVDRERGEREIGDLMAAAIGKDIPFRVLSTDPWVSHMELADRTRLGRVFLAGDAAHLNPPWGGHGMNTGFGDAVDLGWKLAAVLQGWGGQGLLESYELERRPVATTVIAEAEANMRVLSDDLSSAGLEGNDEAALEACQRLHQRIQESKAPEFHSLDLVLGLGYPDSPIVVSPRAGASELPLQARPGYRLPHAWISPRQSVFDRLGSGFTLLYGTDQEAEALAFAAKCQKTVPVTVLDIASLQTAGRYQSGLILVRPDQHVAWAGARLPEPVDDLIELVRGALAGKARADKQLSLGQALRPAG